MSYPNPYLWKVALAVAYQQTCLAAATISDHDNLFGVGRRVGDMGRSRFPTR